MSSSDPGAPDSVQNADVVIVGAGPCGALAAAMLHARGVRATLVEQEARDPELDAGRTYHFALNPRGQAVVKRVPGLFEHLQASAASPNPYIPVKIALDGAFTTTPLYPGQKRGMLFLRPHLVAALRDFVADRCESVTTLYGATVTALEAGAAGDVSLAVDVAGRATILRTRLVLACDGVNSTVLRLLRAAAPGVVDVSANLTSRKLYSPRAGTHVRGIVVSEAVFAHLPDVPRRFDEHWWTIVGKSFNLVILPLSTAYIRRFGGVLAAMAGAPELPLWGLTDADAALDMLAANFPQLRLRECISRESVECFVAARPILFPRVSRVRSLTTRVGGSGFVILGDAAHTTPPHMGQGLNSALEDVAELMQVLDDAPGDTSIHDVLRLYEMRRDADVTGLVELGTFHGRKPRTSLGTWLHVTDSRLRQKMASLFPRFFYPPIRAMFAERVPYGTVLKQQAVTTRRLVAVGAAVVAFVSATVVMAVRLIRKVGHSPD